MRTRKFSRVLEGRLHGRFRSECRAEMIPHCEHYHSESGWLANAAIDKKPSTESFSCELVLGISCQNRINTDPLWGNVDSASL